MRLDNPSSGFCTGLSKLVITATPAALCLSVKQRVELCLTINVVLWFSSLGGRQVIMSGNCCYNFSQLLQKLVV